jgi:hypothetical protein
MEKKISAIVCCLVAALLFANTWQGDFVYDDRWVFTADVFSSFFRFSSFSPALTF